ncbi:MAG TPA: DUF1993 domain-containing protein [Kofleriaceae bacterium]
MSLYLLIREMHKVLGQMDSWFEKVGAHATAKKFDVDSIIHWRMAPDMLPFSAQIGIACDTAKFAAARATGKEAPSHSDDQKTVAEMRTRIESVRTFLDGFKESDFAGTDDRMISLPRWEGKKMTATDYVIEHSVPNFMFHSTTAYLLLRHNGVDVGKKDFLGPLTYR